ncbi:peptidase inhibitor family I36 protein [Streptomyces sp. MNP-20]|uniref:peptidase inhibitor family I36 protein n=1 Tax=Streptomyces sp. MNP-20 TaxID=2721165 RepID=UPI001551A59D|nr:peptidase inhibitor family I36 protein [Streptomyces sp. MNP-20]
MRLRIWSAAVVLTAAATALPAANASAQPHRQGPPPCPDGSVCFYSGTDYQGSSWEWTASSGYQDLPPQLYENVGSFVASTDACFINSQPTETRQVHNGDWRSSYKGDFGSKIDGVNAGIC